MERLRSALRRPLVAGVVLLIAYVALSFANDQRAYFVSDVGGRVATIRAMEHNGHFDVNLGYWAAKWDPKGVDHPSGNVGKIGHAWVTVGTIPTLYLGYPLFELGGYRLMLLIPMLGSIMCAFAARALVKRIRAGPGEWLAFWIVGLASPITLYALDFWDHSVGVALLAWAVIFLWDATRDRVVWWKCAVAGFLFGAAATLRTEAFVYTAVAVVAFGIAALMRRLGVVKVVGGLALVGLLALVPLAANRQLETAAFGTSLRGERTSIYATDATGTSAIKARAETAAQSATFLDPSNYPFAYFISFILLLLLVVGAVKIRGADPGIAMLALAGAGLLYLIEFGSGFGFVPGLVASTPVAVVGAVAFRRQRESWPLYTVALISAPLVWFVQPVGGVLPVWGARYILMTGLILVVLATVALRDAPKWFVVTFVCFSVAVTGFGVGWMIVRTHEVATTGAAVAALPEDVVVSRQGQFFNELGWFGDGQHWLVATGRAKEAIAARIALDSGAKTIAFLTTTDDPAKPILAGYCETAHHTIPFIASDDPIIMREYARTSGACGAVKS